MDFSSRRQSQGSANSVRTVRSNSGLRPVCVDSGRGAVCSITRCSRRRSHYLWSRQLSTEGQLHGRAVRGSSFVQLRKVSHCTRGPATASRAPTIVQGVVIVLCTPHRWHTQQSTQGAVTTFGPQQLAVVALGRADRRRRAGCTGKTPITSAKAGHGCRTLTHFRSAQREPCNSGPPTTGGK